MPRQIVHHANTLAIVFVFFYIVLGVATLKNYGLTWDEGLGNLFFGERYFHYFGTFNEKFLDFKADLSSLKQYPLHLYLSPFHNTPNEFPPVADTLSAMSMYLVSYHFGWLNPVDGFHALTVLLAGGFLYSMYRFSEKRIGKTVAWLAMLFLAFFPRFWADMHFNVKDVPEAIFFGLTIFALWSWYERPGWPGAILSGFLFGLSLGVKANAIFVAPIFALTILPKTFKTAEWSAFGRQIWRLLPQFLAMGITAGAVYLLSWPYLFANPLVNLKAYWGYILSQGGRQGGSGWNWDPLIQAVTTMPEIMLISTIIGLGVVAARAWKARTSVWMLLLVWFSFPLLRASLPGTVNFDGIRHYLEFVPAAAMIAGVGIYWLVERAANSSAWAFLARKMRINGWPRALAPALLAAALAAANMLSTYSLYFPYLHIYYNGLVGGLAGAQRANIAGEEVDYWGASYRGGMEWVRKNAAPDAQVYATPANWLLEISAPIFLRADTSVIPAPLPDFKRLEADPKPTYLFFLLTESNSQDELAYCRQHYPLVYQAAVNTVPILEIYQVQNTSPGGG
jgi:hypothetical protein